MKFLIICFLCINIANAAIPTVEGLFRNPTNAEIDGDIIVFKMSVEETTKKEIVQDEEDIQDKTKAEMGHYKFLIYKKLDSKKFDMIQAEYSFASMKKSELINVSYFKDFNKTLLNINELPKSLFYSIITMYTLNLSDGMSNILSKYGVNYTKNKDSMNKDKVGLMNKYKSYLAKIKKDKELKEEIASPFKPENEEESLKVDELLKKNMYNDSSAITLTKKGTKFYWQVELENIYAMFANKSHNLLYFKLKNNDEVIKAYFSDYMLYDGRHQLPKLISLEFGTSKLYQIKTHKYLNFINKTKTFKERYEDYKELLEKAQKDKTVKDEIIFDKPLIIL